LRRVKAQLALPVSVAHPAIQPQPIRLTRPAWRVWQLAALVLAVMLTGAATVVRWHQQPTGVVAYQFTRTSAGQQQQIRLADNSLVTLAPQSQLRYPKQFGSTHRDVYLEGEAFFEVSKDARRPFRVHSGSWVTQVLGTKFNVSAFRRAAQTSVSLVEGKVRVLDAHNEYLLAPGQQLLAEQATGRVYRRAFNPTKVVAWKSNKLIFQNEKLGDVAGQIERLYNVKLVFADSATAEVRIWATFDNEPLPAVLEALQLAGPIAYRCEGQVIYFSQRAAETAPQ